jgi:hypothetical protein
MTQLFPRIRRIATAITISPRMIPVLAAAWHFAERLNAPLFVIHGGAPDAQKEAGFREAMFQLEISREIRIVWSEGEPAGAHRGRGGKKGVDLLIAGPLEGKDVASRGFLAPLRCLWRSRHAVRCCMLLVGSKESDFDSGTSLQMPLSFLMRNVRAQECYSARTVAWQNPGLQNLLKDVPI